MSQLSQPLSLPRFGGHRWKGEGYTFAGILGHSNDCSELSSTPINPGDMYAVGIGIGPKVCHFQDLLAPLSSSYSGTLQVHDEQEERRLATQD